MLRIEVFLIAGALIATISAALAGEVAPPEIPSTVPNPLKKQVVKIAPITDDLRMLEMALYGEVNADKSDEIRLGALERTIYGTSMINAKLSLNARAENLKDLNSKLLIARKIYAEGKFDVAKAAFSEIMKLLGKEYKSLVKAEVYYRLGMCDYELSNIRETAPGVKISGQLLRTSKELLVKAQDYYKSLGQPERAQEISAFIDTFKDKAATYFLY